MTQNIPSFRRPNLRWATTMSLRYIICVVGIFLLLVSSAFAARDDDSCLSMIPASLAVLLHEKYPEFRLPLAKDGEPSQIEFSRKHGHGDCVLVTSGDFDGNGVADVALLLSHVRTPKVILVSALRKGHGWSIHELPTSCNSIENCYVATGQPGNYEMTQSFDYTVESPNSRERIRSANQVVESGTPESTTVIHAYIRRQWLYVWVSD